MRTVQGGRLLRCPCLHGEGEESVNASFSKAAEEQQELELLARAGGCAPEPCSLPST